MVVCLMEGDSCCDGDVWDMIGRLIERWNEGGRGNDVVAYVTDF